MFTPKLSVCVCVCVCVCVSVCVCVCGLERYPDAEQTFASSCETSGAEIKYSNSGFQTQWTPTWAHEVTSLHDEGPGGDGAIWGEKLWVSAGVKSLASSVDTESWCSWYFRLNRQKLLKEEERLKLCLDLISKHRPFLCFLSSLTINSWKAVHVYAQCQSCLSGMGGRWAWTGASPTALDRHRRPRDFSPPETQEKLWFSGPGSNWVETSQEKSPALLLKLNYSSPLCPSSSRWQTFQGRWSFEV